MPWGHTENNTYLLVFLATFVAVAAWESLRPKRELSSEVSRRWSRHGVLLVVATVASVVLYRASPVVLAFAMRDSRFGVLNKPWLPYSVRFIVTVLLLDFVRYAVHRFHHGVSFLWRVHHVHHSDPDFDVSTGVRAHPIETVLALGADLATIAVLAAPPAAVLAAELLSCAQAFFSHANASLPAWLEKPIRWMFVTPDMHRIHHSEEISEQSMNFGEIFPWWDRFFQTYLDVPAAGQDRMRVGLKGFQNDGSLDFTYMLLHPFKRESPEATSQETPVAS
jgi:sterol desaturase/sphingolipid hydroxylase (fatty acid hydroxylase superfamily)